MNITAATLLKLIFIITINNNKKEVIAIMGRIDKSEENVNWHFQGVEHSLFLVLDSFAYFI